MKTNLPNKLSPTPLFDTMEHIKKIKFNKNIQINLAEDDFEAVKNFLNEYNDNQATFNSYRREVERLLQWSWLIQKKSIFQINRNDIEAYVNFCKNPPRIMGWNCKSTTFY